MIFAVKNSNEYFLKHAFREPDEIFDAEILGQHELIEQLLELLSAGTNIQLIMNVLLYADFESWLKDDIEPLLEFIESLSDTESELSMIFYIYNPIMTICLCCEILTNIGDAHGSFQ